jgi:hypothetical protein
MLRQKLETAYDRTLGSLLRFLSHSGSSFVNSIGVMQLVYALVVIGLMAGLVNALVLPVPSQYAAEAVFQQPGQQTIPETFIDATVILLGGAGIYLTYISGRQTTKSRMVNLYLAFALLLIAVSVMMGIYMVNAK